MLSDQQTPAAFQARRFFLFKTYRFGQTLTPITILGLGYKSACFGRRFFHTRPGTGQILATFGNLTRLRSILPIVYITEVI
jgi:hypothetical protein